MGHHGSCTDWAYDTHPELAALTERCARLESAFSRKATLFARFYFNTRPAHQFLFRPMTPASCTCIAGHYRGDAACPEIQNAYVSTGHDPRVGVPPYLVAEQMKVFEARCKSLVSVHERWLATKGATQPAQNALLKFVDLLADALQLFLTIHPYKDGNGHTGRLLIWLMMARAGYTPVNWSIDAKQPYADALSAHRSGKKGALQKFLLQAIAGAPASAAPAQTPTSA